MLVLIVDVERAEVWRGVVRCWAERRGIDLVDRIPNVLLLSMFA
jgi:hypothetical protein